ncbi:MAG: isoprenoid biosynthesis glyoxalase ElbB [Phycisphaeraceae bacterium]|nr:MAG: isoprenoid biosynthesis glyoxalase ElbB [Phycisphaeraceae bacterium]
MAKKVAVVLSGCGFLDGTEIQEAVSLLVHLDRVGLDSQCFAPDEDQPTIVDHVSGGGSNERRNMMIEGARISRGRIRPLEALSAEAFDGLAFPGGFGVVSNLSTFASEGATCRVHAHAERVIREFHAAKKPIGMCCIAPVLAAKVLGQKFGGPGVTVTLGGAGPTPAAVEAMGNTHEVKGVTEVCVDELNRIVSTPAYMYEAKPHAVFTGIGALADAMARLIG